MGLGVTLVEPSTLEEVFWGSTTHNLSHMAEAAGLYKAVWRPDESDISVAATLIPILEKGLDRLKNNPKWFKTFNPSNGFGSYEGLISFIEKYLSACKDNPEAIIDVCR